MIDWFVLLTPLIVLPILLLFGFLGCTLIGESIIDELPGPVTHVVFLLGGGLHLALDKIQWVFEFSDFDIDTEAVESFLSGTIGGSAFDLPSGKSGLVVLEGPNEIPPNQTPFPDATEMRSAHLGNIECTCAVTPLGAAPTDQLTFQLEKQKFAGEGAPAFTFQFDGNGGFELV